MSQSDKILNKRPKPPVIPRSTTVSDFGIFENMHSRRTLLTTVKEEKDLFSHIKPDQDDFSEKMSEKMSQLSIKNSTSSESNQSNLSQEVNKESYLPSITFKTSTDSLPKTNPWSDTKLSKLMKRL